MGEAWHFGFLQHFRKYFEAKKFSFSIDPKALTSNTNPFVLLIGVKMSNLCIWGKLDILAFFNISGNIMRPKSFPLVLTPNLWSQIPTLLFYYSDLRWAISVYGGSLTFWFFSTFHFRKYFEAQRFSFSVDLKYQSFCCISLI